MIHSEFTVLLWSKALVLDLDQAEQKHASGESDTCGPLVRNPPILRTLLLTEDVGRGIENRELRLQWRYDDFELKHEGGGLWIEDWQSRFEDSIMPL